MPSIENPNYLVIVNLLLLLIMGVVSSSRLVLKAHQPHEVYMGLLIGFTVELIVVYFDLSI
jgi:membrane-associated phospholipid phosphatase